MKYPDWITPWKRADIVDYLRQYRIVEIDTLSSWLESLEDGSLIEFSTGKSAVDYRSPSTESVIPSALQAWDMARHLTTRLGLAHRFGITWRSDVFEPSPHQTQIMLPDPDFVGQVSNADYTRRENEFFRAGYGITIDERLPRHFVDAVQSHPKTSPAWYCKTKPEDRRVHLYAWVLDWRVPGCIDWTRAWFSKLTQQFHPDFVGVAAKTGWHMHGSPRLSVPWDGVEPQTSLHRAGGDFTPSFYAEGEYEELLRQQIHWLLDKGVAVTVQDRPSADGTQASCGSWSDDRIRSEVVGWQ